MKIFPPIPISNISNVKLKTGRLVGKAFISRVCSFFQVDKQLATEILTVLNPKICEIDTDSVYFDEEQRLKINKFIYRKLVVKLIPKGFCDEDVMNEVLSEWEFKTARIEGKMQIYLTKKELADIKRELKFQQRWRDKVTKDIKRMFRL